MKYLVSTTRFARLVAKRIVSQTSPSPSQIVLFLAVLGSSLWVAPPDVEAESRLTTANPPIYLIPAGYAGPVNVYFQIADAPPPIYENGARVYKVAPDGHVLSRLPYDGVFGGEFFLVDTAGKRTPITWESDRHNRALAPDANEVRLRGGNYGTSGDWGGPMDDPCTVRTISFFVGTVPDSRRHSLRITASDELIREDEYLQKHPPTCAKQYTNAQASTPTTPTPTGIP